jgi:hypothetical protein
LKDNDQKERMNGRKGKKRRQRDGETEEECVMGMGAEEGKKKKMRGEKERGKRERRGEVVEEGRGG